MELTQTKSNDKETVITFLFFIFCNIRLISVGGSVICRLPQASLVAVNIKTLVLNILSIKNSELLEEKVKLFLPILLHWTHSTSVG